MIDKENEYLRLFVIFWDLFAKKAKGFRWLSQSREGATTSQRIKKSMTIIW